MAVPTPFNVALAAGSVPAWVATAQTAINAVLNANWQMGQQVKQVTITAAQMGLTQFPRNAGPTIMPFLREYHAAGWRIVWSEGPLNAAGFPTTLVFGFARWLIGDEAWLAQAQNVL